MSRPCGTILAWLLLSLVMLPWQGYAQQTTTKTFSQAEIEQVAAPIALYPDPLLAQVLMASTYPLEIVAAANWIKENPDLKGKPLEDALQQKNWDPSVKTLTGIPQVLAMLSEQLEMTIKLGDAFLAQQQDVLNAIQNLRQRAKAAGNLNSGNEQVVNTEAYNSAISQESEGATSTQQISPSYISIEPTDPDTLYVPSYDPNTVYGSWPYSDYPPYYGYAYTPGMALAYSLGYLLADERYGDVDWNGQGITINVNRYNEFTGKNITDRKWEHDSTHRKGLPYRDVASQHKYAEAQMLSSQVRETFRGHQIVENNALDAYQERMHGMPKVPGIDQRMDQRIDQRQIDRGNQPRLDQPRLDQQRPAQQRLDQSVSPDIQEQKRQYQEKLQKQEQIYQQRQEQDRVQQRDQQFQRERVQQQKEQRMEQQRDQQRIQQQQQRFQQQQAQQVRQQQQQRAAQQQRPDRADRGNAFEGINHPAQARQYSNRGAASTASNRAASRGGRGGGRAR